METVNWKVEGMTCSNCALTISKYLEKEGLENVMVNPIDGDVRFDAPEQASKEQLAKGINALGYQVTGEQLALKERKPLFKGHLQRFLFCLVFTLPLLMHMFVHVHWLMNPWVQFALTLPVYMVGMSYFGVSAVKSIRNGVPNMNVLIALGATAAFFYSLTGAILGLGDDFLFFETAATIITLVFLGYYMEDASIHSTQKALNKLVKSQKVMANMIAFDDQHQEVVFPVENTQLRSGDLVLIKSGDQVPADCKILWGEGSVDESIITGESLPLEKGPKDHLIGGSILTDGTVKAQVTSAADASVLSNIINLVKRAQGEKPPVQRMADRISAVFIPAVLVIALLTFIITWIVLNDPGSALKHSIAVLVIACPCAMGLATPAAIAVGLGRAARNGILFRNAKSLESFKSIRQVVFDKTGTLTTGKFVVSKFAVTGILTEEEAFKNMVFSLEKYSNHPIANAIRDTWKTRNETRWASIREIKGLGMEGKTKEGDVWMAGSYAAAAHATTDDSHNVYLLKNNALVGWVDVKDEIRPEAAKVIAYLHKKYIKTILLSGDRKQKCDALAAQLGIMEVHAEKTPEEKLQLIEQLAHHTPTAMVGDGINDAPALAKATIGISLSDASQVAMQTADVVLMNKGLTMLPEALGLGKHTFLTIKQNLFWAFLYNIIAIPVAAFGFLTPTVGALVMGLSDVVLAGNSVRLFVKKVQ